MLPLLKAQEDVYIRPVNRPVTFQLTFNAEGFISGFYTVEESYMSESTRLKNDTEISFGTDAYPLGAGGRIHPPSKQAARHKKRIGDRFIGTSRYFKLSLFKLTYENICFTFQNGKIIKATANNSDKLNAVLDQDEGCRYLGEFAIGVNPYILSPMKDTLFDEKIMGSIHLTPGRCYEDAPNGNDSTIHWDLVYIQTPEYGGGEIYFDDVLIQEYCIFRRI